MSHLFVALIALAGWLTSASGSVEVRFGNLHAHSNASDGNPSVTPAMAFETARKYMDFLSLSEHNHASDTARYASVRAAATAATVAGTFVALYGQEYSTISHGNHTNIQALDALIPEADNGRYRKVFEGLSSNATAVAGFNHPGKLADDYGFTEDFKGSWADFRAVMDPVVQLIAVASGPSDSDAKSFLPATGYAPIHRDISAGRWFTYLGHGMHLAPKVDHDTHSFAFGNRVQGRTAVWVPKGGFTRDALLAALRARHVYATEDSNLRIIPKVGEAFLPGDVVWLTDAETLTVTLEVTDDDEPGATYTVAVYAGSKDSGQKPKKMTKPREKLSGNGTVTLSLPLGVGIAEYFVIQVVQKATDPKAGCPSDEAWLAPIWVEWGDAPASPTTGAPLPGPAVDDDDTPANAYPFAGSRNSKVYHHSTCKVVQSIAPHNLRYYVTAPDKRRLHTGCPTE